MNYLSFYTLNKKHSTGFVLLLVLALTAFVAWIVFVLMRPKLEAGLRQSHWDWYCLATFLLMSAAATVFYLSKRVHVVLDDDENYAMAVYVKDRSLGNLEVRYPYSLRKQWCYTEGAKHIKMPMLFVTFCDPQGEPLLTFHCTKGALGDVSDDYEFVDLLLDIQSLHIKQGQNSERLLLAPNRIYNTVKTEDIARFVDDFLITLAKRQKKNG